MAPRRSTRLHPQTHTSEQGAGMARRRRHLQIQPSADGAGVNPRLHPPIHVSEEVAAGMARRTGTSPAEAAVSLPDENGRSEQGATVACLRPQIQPSDEGAGVTRRRSLPLHPQIHASEEEGAGVARLVRHCRAGTSPAAADASLPDDDDMLREILLRLPPQPSSLPRASAVCKRWLGLVTDPRFHSQFFAHHRKPPLLGVFERGLSDGHPFRSILDSPYCIPPERFDLRRQTRSWGDLLGCRHGRVLLMEEGAVIVCNPITSKRHHIEVPPEFRGLYYIHGDVLCTATDQGHVHGNCHSSPFKVVLMCTPSRRRKYDTPPTACVYSSETGLWGNIISTTDRCGLDDSNHGVLVGNVLYWSSKRASSRIIVLDEEDFTDDIIEFDLDRQSLAVIKGPPCLYDSLRHQIIQTDNGDVGLAMLSQGRFEMWQRKVNFHDGATWLLHKTIEMHTLLGLPTRVEGSMRGLHILGYDEDNGAIFVYWGKNVYMVQLMSMQSRKLYETNYAYNCYPFTSFYAPARGRHGAKMLPIG